MKHLLILLVVTGFITACKPEKPASQNICQQNPGNCQSVTEGKKYFAFKLGSWWVYEEENSGRRNSVYVTTSYINPDNYDFDIRTQSTLEGYGYHYWPVYASGAPSCSMTLPNVGRCLLINRSKGKPGDFVGESYCFFFNHLVNDFIYTGSDLTFCPENKITVATVQESYSNHSLNFARTIKIKEECSYIEGIQPVNYYYSRNVGLIRKELIDSNQVWKPGRLPHSILIIIPNNNMKHLLILLVVIGFIAACKEKPVEKPYCQQNPGACETVMEGKKYFAFGMGSWWVYEEESTGLRDSVYVTEASNDPNGYNFDLRTHSTFQEYNYHYWPTYINTSTCSLHGTTTNKCLFINRSKGKPGDFVGESQCFFVNFVKGSFETTGSGMTYCINNKIIVDEIFNTYSIGNYFFGKTVKIHELCNSVEGRQPTNHFYAKDIGLIRKEFLDSNQVWNLVDYHIET